MFYHGSKLIQDPFDNKSLSLNKGDIFHILHVSNTLFELSNFHSK